MNNMNDAPAFQVDTSTMEDTKPIIQFQPPSTTEAVVTQTPPKVEVVTVAAPNPVATGSSSVSTAVTTVSASQSHVPSATVNHTPKGIQPTTSNQANAANHDQILTKTRLQDLVKEIDPCEQLDEEVEDLLLQLVDDFVTNTVNTACVFAKHRNASTVEVRDVQLYLERTYNMWIPGFGTEEVKPYKKPPTTEAHKQRLALIRKSLRKY